MNENNAYTYDSPTPFNIFFFYLFYQ